MKTKIAPILFCIALVIVAAGCKGMNLNDEVQFWGGTTTMIATSEALRQYPYLRPDFEAALAALNGLQATSNTDRAAFLTAIDGIDEPQVRVPLKLGAAGLSRYGAHQTNEIATAIRSITEGMAAVLAQPQRQ